jgi:hypothetical protein
MEHILSKDHQMDGLFYFVGHKIDKIGRQMMEGIRIVQPNLRVDVECPLPDEVLQKQIQWKNGKESQHPLGNRWHVGEFRINSRGFR